MLFISPPFGNYLRFDGCIPIRGSFTLQPRDGLFLQILKTLRYSADHQGWVNQIGLRNRGLDYAVRTYSKGEVVSIAIQDAKQIPEIVQRIPSSMDIELNVSCPNVGTSIVQYTPKLKSFLNDKRTWCIVKLPPQLPMHSIDAYYNDGFRQFHCCNTLPSQDGGVSGPTLRPYVLQMVKNIKSKYPDTTVIAGGGVRDVKSAQDYNDNGADHISISTLCFNPVLMSLFVYEYRQSQ